LSCAHDLLLCAKHLSPRRYGVPAICLAAIRHTPFACIDRPGLLWLLDGRKLVMLAADGAAIETPTGARQTCRRTAELGYMVLA
jgi:hypothetical protein